MVSIADHFGGYVEIDSSKPGNPQQFSEVTVYLRVADKDWDESYAEFIDNMDTKQNDDV